MLLRLRAGSNSDTTWCSNVTHIRSGESLRSGRGLGGTSDGERLFLAPPPPLPSTQPLGRFSVHFDEWGESDFDRMLGEIAGTGSSPGRSTEVGRLVRKIVDRADRASCPE